MKSVRVLRDLGQSARDLGISVGDEGIQRVTCVVMEATSDYWKPFYYLLEDIPGVEVMLVNARHVKNVPGRKTHVADAT